MKKLYFIISIGAVLFGFRYFKNKANKKDDDMQLIGEGIKYFLVKIEEEE